MAQAAGSQTHRASAAGVVLSVGSINADFQLRIDSFADFGRALRPGRDLARLSGGKAANVAVLARRLGCEARLLGRVGGDDLAEQALAPLRAEGVDLRAVRHAAGEQTGVAVLAVAPDGSKQSVSAAEANLGFDDADLRAVEGAVRAAPAASVLAADYEVTPAAVSCAIAAARACGLPIVVDPSFPHLVERGDLRGIAVLTPNEREARALAGVGQGVPLADVAQALAALGPRSICIKLDGGGCLLLHDGQLWHQHAAAAKAVDTSGAGDAFTGTIAVALAEGRGIEQAALLAVAATELAVTAYGAQPSYPVRARLEAHLRDGSQRPLRPWAG
jgi:ribokinase